MTLQEIRLSKGMSQSQLAERADVKLTSIQKYERGARDINKATAEILYKLATALECSMEELINKEAI